MTMGPENHPKQKRQLTTKEKWPETLVQSLQTQFQRKAVRHPIGGYLHKEYPCPKSQTRGNRGGSTETGSWDRRSKGNGADSEVVFRDWT